MNDKYCVVCGKVFIPKENANLCCSKCGWSQFDAIFSGRGKFNPQTGKEKW